MVLETRPPQSPRVGASLLQRIRGSAGEMSLQEDLSLPIPSLKQKTGISQPQIGHQPATQAGPAQKYPSGVHPIIYFLCHGENYIFFLQELPSLPHNSECWTELGDAPIKDSCPAPVPGQDPRFSGPSGAIRTKRPRRAGGWGVACLGPEGIEFAQIGPNCPLELPKLPSICVGSFFIILFFHLGREGKPYISYNLYLEKRGESRNEKGNAWSERVAVSKQGGQK